MEAPGEAEVQEEGVVGGDARAGGEAVTDPDRAVAGGDHRADGVAASGEPEEAADHADRELAGNDGPPEELVDHKEGGPIGADDSCAGGEGPYPGEEALWMGHGIRRESGEER